ncbi:class I SAM-dependent methyltransferase [Sinorhizobium fredii]|uniref:class I SAM-dependent methyltransferase n=1 Tax=Rhizobium fredii TaxID=380 RepID=UPI0004AE9167|nr:class I SAM-dependent methyltransferase [Sinorhizobium fredii]MQW97473.1 methyltransferase domain-containing protein [Sinorhizobium fredii]
MSYEHFLEGLAQRAGLPDSKTFLSTTHAEKYKFAITNRERGKGLVSRLSEYGIKIDGAKVLDVGCAYGGNTIEMTLAGATAVGIDIDEKWLKLGELNARGECSPTFYLCDASTKQARRLLQPHGPFDLVIVNDVFEHIFDTAGLLENVSSMVAKGGKLYFQVPNGLAPRFVLSEGHKKIFGISLLAPDYWPHFVKTPFHVYYRRWEYFHALFKEYGFDIELFESIQDMDEGWTRRKLGQEIKAITVEREKQQYTGHQGRFIDRALEAYFFELRQDLKSADWKTLKHKYRTAFWEGVITKR